MVQVSRLSSQVHTIYRPRRSFGPGICLLYMCQILNSTDIIYPMCRSPYPGWEPLLAKKKSAMIFFVANLLEASDLGTETCSNTRITTLLPRARVATAPLHWFGTRTSLYPSGPDRDCFFPRPMLPSSNFPPVLLHVFPLTCATMEVHSTSFRYEERTSFRYRVPFGGQNLCDCTEGAC